MFSSFFPPGGISGAAWLEFIGLAVSITGMVIGLGGVTVIDIHALLGRTSSYWKEATIRTHKITKPLIWIGLIVATLGGALLYGPTGFDRTAPLQAVIGVILVVNGLYLTFTISPYLLRQEKEGRSGELLPMEMQRVILLSFLLSFLCWWAQLFLLAWSVTVLR